MSRTPLLNGSDSSASDDEWRDLRLLAALRHAPDRTAEPPAAVSQTILSAAHAAAHTAARNSRRPHVATPSSSASVAAALHRRWADAMRRIWSSLGAPRPLWAGASAVLLVSVVTVRMWVDEPLPAAVVRSSPAAEPLPAPAPQAAERSDSAVAGAPNPAARVAEPMAAPMAAPSRSPAATAKTRTPESPPEPTREPRVSQAPTPTPTPTPTSTPILTPTQPTQPSRTPLPLPMPIPAPVPEPSLATVPPAASAEAPAPPSPARSEIARAAGAQPSGAALAARIAAAPAQKTALPVRPPSLSAWLTAARDEVDDPARPLTPSQRRLLRQLDRATLGTRWQQLAPTPASGLDMAARELALQAANGATATLRLDATGVHWQDAEGGHWVAELDTATRQRLRQDW